MTTSDTTRDLVLRCQTGAEGAADQLYVRLYPTLRAVALLTAGERARRDPHLADDVVHRAFVDVAGRLRGPDDFGARVADGFTSFMQTAVAHLVISWGRQQDRRRELQFGTGVESAPALAGRGPGGATVAELRDTLQHMFGAVEDALLELSERDRQVIVLRYLCGLDSEQTCAAMRHDGQPTDGFRAPEQVRVTLSRALERLRGRLRVDGALVDRYFQILDELAS
jgi:RNA polymerase sigma factor (sigma-70 family)